MRVPHLTRPGDGPKELLVKMRPARLVRTALQSLNAPRPKVRRDGEMVSDIALTENCEARRSGRMTLPFGPRGISFVGVRKSFDVTKALDGCSFSATLGEIPRDLRRQRLRQEHAREGHFRRAAGRCRTGQRSWPYAEFADTRRAPSASRRCFRKCLCADECSILDNLYIGADRLWSRRRRPARRSGRRAS